MTQLETNKLVLVVVKTSTSVIYKLFSNNLCPFHWSSNISQCTWNTILFYFPIYSLLSCFAACSNSGVAELTSLPEPETFLTASSVFTDEYLLEYSLLNNEAGAGSWSSATRVVGEWIQVDLQVFKVIVKVATQGRHLSSDEQFVTSYKLQTSLLGTEFDTILNADGSENIFTANTDINTVVEHCLDYVQAQYVRLSPQTWHLHISLRWEVYTLEQGIHNPCTTNTMIQS